MVNGLNIPDSVALFILVGALALAVWNIHNVMRLLRIPQTFGKLMGWLATIARDAFVQGASEGITDIVRQELYPNGGDNIRDVADRNEELGIENRDQVAGLRRSLENHMDDVDAHRRRVEEHLDDPEAHDADD